MKRKNKIIFSLTGITIIMLALLGFTYGYYLTNIYGNTNSNSISVTTADLMLTYDDNNSYIDMTNIMPGTSASKTFTVSNLGTEDLEEYAVGIDEVTNTLTRTQDLTYSITCFQKQINEDDSKYEPCDKTASKTGIYPKTNSEILNNSIGTKNIQKYTITIAYANPDEDQSIDMGSTIKGRMQIYSTADTIELTGSVDSYMTGDYVQINSEPKTSQLSYNEETKKYEYKLIGVPIGEHTISIRNGSTIRGSKSLSIKQGISAGYDNEGSLTITNISEKASVNLGNISNNTFELTMSTPKDKDIIPPIVVTTFSTDIPKTYNAFDITINLNDDSGIDLNNSKYILNKVSTPINGLNGYEWNDIITNPLTFSIRQVVEGTYYLHVISEDLEGNIKENIDIVNITKSISSVNFIYTRMNNCTLSYEFEEGMTWKEFIGSKYDTRGFRLALSEPFYVKDSNGCSTDSYIDDVIQPNASFTCTMMTPDCF